MKSSQISVEFFFPAQLSLRMSNKKTPFPPTALPGFMFPMYFFFLSFSFLLFPVKTHGKKISGETELGGEREEAIEFHREVRLQANRKGAEILL